MTTLSEIRDRVYRVLADPDQSQFELDLLDDGLRAAHEAILPWIFKRAEVELTADGATVSWQLPSTLYRVIAVFDADSGIYIPQNILSTGRSPGADLASNQDWLLYPEGYIDLANPPDTDLTVYYAETWTFPVTDETNLETPSWCDQALVFYAASYALLDRASAAANIRQWNVDVDSGTPVMNPMRDMSSYFHERFRIEMDRMPARVRGVHG